MKRTSKPLLLMCSSGRVRFNDVSVSNGAQSYADYENISPPDIDLRHVLYFRKRRTVYSGMHGLFEERKLCKTIFLLML